MTPDEQLADLELRLAACEAERNVALWQLREVTERLRELQGYLDAQ